MLDILKKFKRKHPFVLWFLAGWGLFFVFNLVNAALGLINLGLPPLVWAAIASAVFIVGSLLTFHQQHKRIEELENNRNVMPAPPPKRKPTKADKLSNIASAVDHLRFTLLQESRFLSETPFDKSIPPKIASLYISIRKEGLETPDVPTNISWRSYKDFHNEYFENILPYLKAGQIGEAKEAAKTSVVEIHKKIADKENE